MRQKINKNAYALILLSFFSVNVICQDKTLFYGANHEPIASEEGARFSKKILDKNRKTKIVESYYMIDSIWNLTQTEKIKISNENIYLVTVKPVSGSSYRVQRNFRKVGEGMYQFSEYLEEELIRSGNTSQKLPLCLQDTIHEYYREGQLKSIAVYEDNQLKSNVNWLKDGSKYYDNIFYSVDEEPDYALGKQHFNRYIIDNLLNAGIDLSNYEGKLIIGWVVTESGDIVGVHTVSGYYHELSKFIVAIIDNSPGKWEPATLNGEHVNYFMQYPINMRNASDNHFDALELSDGFIHWD